MADYYPLIARAIAGLDPSAPGESRRALYERARAARSGDAFRASTGPSARPGETAPPSTSQAPRPRPPSPQGRNERPPGQEDRQDQRPPRNLRADAPPPSRPQPPNSQPQVPMPDPQLPPTRQRARTPRRGPDNSAPQAPD